jgi:hypothetical protein
MSIASLGHARAFSTVEYTRFQLTGGCLAFTFRTESKSTEGVPWTDTTNCGGCPVKKYTLCAVLLLTLPAHAAISEIQSKAKWVATGGTCAVTFTSFPATHNLIVVWTSWTTSGTNNVTVTSVKDTLNNGTSGLFPSAVGPTIQSASNTVGQIFYAGNITGGSSDQVTVTFSSAPSSSNCVIVEYSGADLNYPLDSSSAGHGNSTGTTLDSGYSASAFPVLMVFGAGIVDVAGAPTAGSSFTTRQSNSSGFCALAEDNVTPTAGSLQHANATCANSGNWLMQMAVFRDASPTVTGGWSPSRPSKILYADQYPGSDACIQIANAFADAPPTGGIVDARGLIPTTANTTLDLLGKPDSHERHRSVAA